MSLSNGRAPRAAPLVLQEHPPPRVAEIPVGHLPAAHVVHRDLHLRFGEVAVEQPAADQALGARHRRPDEQRGARAGADHAAHPAASRQPPGQRRRRQVPVPVERVADGDQLGRGQVCCQVEERLRPRRHPEAVVVHDVLRGQGAGVDDELRALREHQPRGQRDVRPRRQVDVARRGGPLR